MSDNQLASDIRKLTEARHHDPFAVLGRHGAESQTLIRTILPRAEEATIAEGEHLMQRVEGTDIFEWRGQADGLPAHYRIIWRDQSHREHIAHDP